MQLPVLFLKLQIYLGLIYHKLGPLYFLVVQQLVDDFFKVRLLRGKYIYNHYILQVDQKFEKNHLFKRSIMLIKAWCYYESRILGAHHGLISTYALEILVLYIFHLFHGTLDGPLAVSSDFQLFCSISKVLVSDTLHTLP
jgi:hypothetical protein